MLPASIERCVHICHLVKRNIVLMLIVNVKVKTRKMLEAQFSARWYIILNFPPFSSAWVPEPLEKTGAGAAPTKSQEPEPLGKKQKPEKKLCGSPALCHTKTILNEHKPKNILLVSPPNLV